MPPLDVQQRVVELVREESVVNEAIASSIRAVREYQLRLVSDVVTGQLDVREAARNLPDLESEAATPDAYDLDANADLAEDLEGDEAA